MKVIDLTGKRFGRWLVVKFVEVKATNAHWRVRCDCGNEKTVNALSLKNGDSQSCGCLQKEIVSAKNTTHGHTRGYKISPEYRCWAGLIQRCYNPKVPGYKDYGGRGIPVCDRWRNSFVDCFADMGQRPEGIKGSKALYSIERIDNDKGYGPENCQWATAMEQRHNRRPTRPWRRKGPRQS